MSKEKEFDFEKSYQEIMEQAEASGLSDDMVFQTLMNEFKRMKNVCDELYKTLEDVGVAYEEDSFKGRKIFKSNPLTKEYVSAHKTFVSTCGAIKEMLAKVGDNNSDWL